MSSSANSPDSPSVAQAQIKQFYQGILDHAPDAAGLNAWTATYENGLLSYSQIESDIIAAPEVHTFVAPIITLYQAAFNRVPDQAGLAKWVQAYEGGTSLPAIAQALLSSPEAQRTYGASVSAINASADAKLAFVQALYQNILGRQGTTAEVGNWANSGMSATQILLGIATSQEATQTNAAAITQFLTAAGTGTQSYTGTLAQQMPVGRRPPGPTPSGTGQAYTLTSGPYTIVGTPGDDTFNGTFQTNGFGNSVSTLNPFDSIDGNGGNDTLNIVDTTSHGALSNGLPPNVTLTNIANVNIASTGVIGNTSPLDLTQISGLTNANVISTGGDTVQATNATNVTASDTAPNVNSNLVNVIGGLTDTVNTQGASVNVSRAAGAVQVNVTRAKPSQVTITGGTTVGVNELGATINNVTGAATPAGNNTPITIGAAPTVTSSPTRRVINNLAQDPTGDVTVNVSTPFTNSAGSSAVDFGTGAATIYTNGAGTVSATGVSSATITDVQTTPQRASASSTLAPGTSTLATVNLDGLSGAAPTTITSNALANLSVLDSGAQTVNVVDTTRGALNLTVGNDRGITVRDNAATSVNVGTQASAYQAINNGPVSAGSTLTLNTPTATALNISNGQTLTLTEPALSGVGNVKTVTASGSGTLVMLDASTWGALKSINASAATGAITTAVNDSQTSFTGGSGHNGVVINNIPAYSLNGGSGGSNTLVLDASSGNFPTAIYNNSKVSNFQTLGLGSANASGTYDGGGFSQFSLFNTGNPAAASAVTIAGISSSNTTLSDQLPTSSLAFANGVDLDFDQGRNSLTVNMGRSTSAGVGVTDTLNLTTSVRGTQGGVTGLTINSLGAGAPANSVLLTDPSLTSLSITGDEGVTVNSALTTTGITTIDASGNTAVPSAAGTSGRVDVTGITGQLSAGGATITGGGALLVATSSNAPDTVTSGSGGLDLNIAAGNSGEMVHLDNSPDAADTLAIADGDPSLGTTASTLISTATVVSGFQTYGGIAGAASDSLGFLSGATVFNPGSLPSANPSGLTDTVRNGVVTFGGNGLASAPLSSLVQFLEGQLDALGPQGAGNTAAFQYGSDTYVVHSSATTHNPGSPSTDRVVDLQGLTGITSLTTSQPTSATALWVHNGTTFA